MQDQIEQADAVLVVCTEMYERERQGKCRDAIWGLGGRAR